MTVDSSAIRLLYSPAWWQTLGETMTSLVLDQISKRFEANEVLSSVSLALGAGERMAIVGESGSGKTTLLRIIAGLESPSSGRVRLDSVDVTTLPPNRRNIGIVFQDYATYPRLSVAENLTVSLVGNSITKTEKVSRLNDIATWLELEPLLRRLPTELSGGQLQRVALGKALINRPKFLLLDEPFSQLDVRLAGQLRRLLDETHTRYGTTLIMVTHQPMDALCSVDKLAILDQGRLAQFATPDEVRKRPSTRFAAELTSPCGLNVLPAKTLIANSLPDESGTANDFSSLGQVHVCFRPESVRWSPSDLTSIHEVGAVNRVANQGGAAGLLHFRCRLGAEHLLGIVRLREATVGEHKILIRGTDVGLDSAVRSFDMATMAIGDTGICSVHREDILIFPT